MQSTQESFFVRHATGVALVVLSAITILITFIFWQQVRTRDKSAELVTHTYEVIGHIEQLSGSLKEAIIGERGYIISGDENFLKPYQKVLRNMPEYNAGDRSLQQQRSVYQQLAWLRRMTRDNPVQQAHMNEIEEATKNLLSHIEKTVELRKSIPKGEGFAPLLANITHGRELMEDIRHIVRIMETEESNLLSLRLQNERVNSQLNAYITFVSIALFYVLLAFSIWLYQRNRARAQKEARRYTLELEEREEELKLQQEELKASNEELEEKSNTLEEQNTRIQKQAIELEEAKQLIEIKVTELETASRYKSEFLANMSHELRTPLNSLLILARSFAANEEGNLTKKQIEEAQVIHNGGLELLNLINDILDLSKVEAGKLNIAPEDIHIQNIAKRMSQQFDPVAREKGVALKVHVDQGLPEILHTDSQRVEQILKNLLSNAFKFTEKGTVTLDIHYPGTDVELQRASLVGNGVVAFSVRDTGIGIDESKFRDIFEAFQQEDGSTERHYGGTGLGLTIARKFAHMLGGEIHVSSKKGEGSVFTLFLPQVRGAERDAAQPKPTAVTDTPLSQSATRQFVPDDRNIITVADKIALIIEDDRDFAITLIKIARQRGYKCLAAGDGKSGIVLAAEYPVSAIILDLRLPDIDGMNVLDQLKHSLRTRHIPVHIVSGVAQSQTVVPLRKGAIGYLTKPVTCDDIDKAFKNMENILSNQVKKVLVVEDDRNTQTAIQNLLRQKDIEITVAGTGGDALNKLRAEAFDCIILDLKLPDMTGFAWLKAMESELREERIPPVIIYTARELTEEENRELNRYTGSIVIKGASSSERLLDEVTLFLHSVESTLSDAQKEMIRMNHDPDHALQNRTIMLVDDDMRNTFALSKLLKKHGMNVIIADNGQMALDKLANEPAIELVIMDIMMPIMDGYQAMREIRKGAAWQSLPVIALTARAMPEEQERCMEAGANDYLTKPVDVERLLTLLRVWLFRQKKAA